MANINHFSNAGISTIAEAIIFLVNTKTFVTTTAYLLDSRFKEVD